MLLINEINEIITELLFTDFLVVYLFLDFFRLLNLLFALKWCSGSYYLLNIDESFIAEIMNS